MAVATATSTLSAESRVIDESLDVQIGATEAFASPEDFEKSLADVAKSIHNSIERAGKFREYAEHGRQVVIMGRKQMRSLPDKQFSIKQGNNDYKRLCDRVTDAVVMSGTAPGDVRVATYVRMFVWAIHVKSLLPEGRDVYGLSYYVVANKLLPTLDFDNATLIGSIKADWQAWVMQTVCDLLDGKLSSAQLDKSIADETKRIKDKKNAVRNPEAVAKEEKLAMERQANKPRKQAREAVINSVASIIEEGFATPQEIVALVKDGLVHAKADASCMDVNPKMFGFIAESATEEDFYKLAAAIVYFQPTRVGILVSEFKRLLSGAAQKPPTTQEALMTA